MAETAPSTFPLRRYLSYARFLLFETKSVLWMMALVALANALTSFLHGSTLFWPVTFFSILLTTCTTPVFYGIFFHLIDDSYTSVFAIARTYIFRYLWLLLRMYLPAILLSSIPAILFAGNNSGGYLEIGLVFFSMLYLYVIPLFYHTGQQHQAIAKGIRFLSRNLSASTPLLLTVLVVESSIMLLQYGRSTEEVQPTALTACVDFSVFFAASVIDLAVFIVILYVLRGSDQQSAPGVSGSNL